MPHVMWGDVYEHHHFERYGGDRGRDVPLVVDGRHWPAADGQSSGARHEDTSPERGPGVASAGAEPRDAGNGSVDWVPRDVEAAMLDGGFDGQRRPSRA